MEKNDTKATCPIAVEIVPRVEYSFQAVAVEDKGILGIDYNRSPIVKFATSRLESKTKKSRDENNLNIVSVKSREKTEKGGANKVITLSTQATPPQNNEDNEDLVVLESKDSGN